MSAGVGRMDVGVGRADRAAHPCPSENAEQDQHLMPTANSIDRRAFGGTTTPNTMIAAPTAMTVMVCPTPQAAPISAEPATLRSRLTMVAMATTWCVAHAASEKEAEKQEGHDVQGGSGHCARAKLVIPAIVCSVSTQRQFPYARAERAHRR